MEKSDSQRDSFARFWLLNDAEFKTALTAPIKQAVHETAEKFFQGAHVFEFDASDAVVGFYGRGADAHDHVFKFLEPVKCGDDRAAFFAQLLQAIKDVTKRDIHAEIEKGSWSVDANPNCIAEAVLVADEVHYSKMVEEAIPAGGLYAAFDKATEMVTRLIDHVKVEKSAGMKKLLTARMTIAITWKTRIAKLVNSSCRALNDLQWKSFSRYYLQDGRVCVKTAEHTYEKLGEHCAPHHYEYQGSVDILVATDQTEMLNFNYHEAIGTGKGHVALGPAGTGKTESAKVFARKLGRRMVVINCSDQEGTVAYIKNIFKAVCAGEVWMCLDEFNRTAIEHIQELLPLFACKKGAKQETGYFININPGYAGRTLVKFNTEEWIFNHVTFSGTMIIAQNMLATAGFCKYEEIGRRLEKWRYESIFELCENRKARGHDFGLRKVKEIIQCAATHFSKHQESEEASLLHSIMISVGAGVQDQHQEVFIKVLTQNGFKPQEYVASKIAKAVHPSYDAEKFQRKCAEFAVIAEQRHAIQVIGHGHGFVEAIAKANDCHIVTVDCMNAEADGFTYSDKNPFGHKKGSLKEADRKGSVGCWFYGFQKDSVWTEGKWPLALKELISGETSKKQGLKIAHWKVDHLDAILAENCNSLFDDNRSLNLANGEVIVLPKDVIVVIEGEHYNNQAPATVARCGHVWFCNE